MVVAAAALLLQLSLMLLLFSLRVVLSLLLLLLHGCFAAIAAATAVRVCIYIHACERAYIHTRVYTCAHRSVRVFMYV